MPARFVAERYELRELLGEGGMGFVYRAIDTRTGGLVAVKTMRDISDARSLELFKKEWKVLARLTHPNIVDIRDVDEIEEDGVRKPCFVMPLLNGVTLAQLIKDSSSRLTVQRVVGIISQVCNGLEAAHKLGLIHRDLKPSNIFVMEDDTAKVIDFGLVHDNGINSFAGFKGTFSYASPEQIDDKQLTPESDIYSLGVVAYEALTGRSPFKRPTADAIRQAVRAHHPPAISELNPKVSQLVSKVIHKAMAKQPMHRYPSAKVFGETLQKAYRNEPIERFEPARILPRIERARKAFERDDCAFASDILSELEAEGNVDPEITLLRAQINESVKQKRVRHLFEAAQSRLEQDEILLALDKLREILEIDPYNTEALAMQKRAEDARNNSEISRWMKIAQQHIETHDYQEARQAVQEILNIRYDDSDALHLLSEIDAQEKEATNARREKEQLYGSALRAYQGGEISNALSKLEKILDVSRRSPGATVPERDAVYQSFYNRVRSERDTIDKAYEDGRKYLNDKDFAKALEICNEMLGRYPGSAQFQALKLKIEQSERQELSSYIAEIARSVDSEPELDRRVSILEDACGRYPSEGQFQQSLRLAREQRDLVNSILAKARQYEEGSQFADAIGQWKILRNIHPQYPGIEFEIAQLEKRREQHSAEEKKVRFVEQIDRAISNGAYGKAVELAGHALNEFPQDPELAVLDRIAKQGLERTREADSIFEQARKARAEKRFDESIELLKSALQLDEHNGGIRNTLVNLLVERAHLLLDEDWRRAEPLVQAAADLDANHPAVKRLRNLVGESRRKDVVTQCMADARQLHLTGNIQGALDLIDNGLSHYPDDPKLKHLQAKLQNTISAPKENIPAPELKAPPAPVLNSVAEGRSNPFAPSIIEPNSFIERSADVTPPQTQGDQAETKPKPPVLASIAETPKFPAIPPKKIAIFAFAAAAGVIVAAMIFHLVNPKGPTNPSEATGKLPRMARQLTTVPVALSPSDATLKLDGKPVKALRLNLEPRKKYKVSISHLGYVEQIRELTPEETWKFDLVPESLRVQVVTGEHAGQVLLDGKEIWNLREGDLSSYAIPCDGEQHTLLGQNQGASLFEVDFRTKAAGLPEISPLSATNVVVAVALGKDARVYGAGRRSISVNGAARQMVSARGADLKLEDQSEEPATLAVSDGRRTQNFALVHGNAPTLSILLGENPNVATLVADTAQPGAQLFLDGQERRTSKAGHWRIAGLKPGEHELRATAPGFADTTLKFAVEKGKETKQTIEFAAATAYLVIKDGPPGAELVLDGTTVALLDGSGNSRRPVSPAAHTVELKHEGFESLPLRRSFNAGQNIEFPGHDLVRAFGTLLFDVKPAAAVVSYRREGESEARIGSATGSIKLKAGSYRVTADLDGHKSSVITVHVASGESTPTHIELEANTVTPPPPPVSVYVRVSDVTSENGWSTGSGKMVDLRPRAAYMITFLKPDRVPLKHKGKKIEWRVGLYPDGEILYELDDHHLTRTVKRISVPQAKNVITLSPWSGDQANVNVTTQDHKVTVAVNGAKDEMEDTGHDWSKAVISLRGDQYFRVIPVP